MSMQTKTKIALAPGLIQDLFSLLNVSVVLPQVRGSLAQDVMSLVAAAPR